MQMMMMMVLEAREMVKLQELREFYRVDTLQFTNYRKYYSYYNDYELILVVFRISSTIWEEVYHLIASTKLMRETNGKLSTLSYANFGAVSGHNCYFAECCIATK